MINVCVYAIFCYCIKAGEFCHCQHTSPHFLPVDTMIAPDFCPQRVPATESIAVAMVEEARAR